MPTKKNSKSIKAPKMYEGMVKDGMPKDMAAAISNGLQKKKAKKQG